MATKKTVAKKTVKKAETKKTVKAVKKAVKNVAKKVDKKVAKKPAAKTKKSKKTKSKSSKEAAEISMNLLPNIYEVVCRIRDIQLRQTLSLDKINLILQLVNKIAEKLDIKDSVDTVTPTAETV